MMNNSILKLFIFLILYFSLQNPISIQMSSMLSDNATIHNIPTLKEQLALIIHRQRIQIDESQMRQMGQFLLIAINDRFNKENEVIKNIALKWDQFISSWTTIKNQYEAQINQLNQEIDEKSIQIDNLQEIVSHFEKKIEIYEQKYETLKNQLLISNQNTLDSYKEFQRQKQAFKRTEKEMADQIQGYKYAVSTLNNEKKILLDQMNDERSQNSDLKDTVRLFRIQIESYHKYSKLENVKSFELLRQNEDLLKLIDDKMNIIQTLAHQVGFKRVQELQRLKFLPIDIGKIEFNCKQAQRHYSHQIINCKSFVLQLHKREYHSSLFQLNSSLSMDPYFTHFVLTSQSVKIKQECEQLLNIDVKPFYTEIIQKRIPMHIWDQWIRNKLRSVLKQQRGGSESGQSEN